MTGSRCRRIRHRRCANVSSPSASRADRLGVRPEGSPVPRRAQNPISYRLRRRLFTAFLNPVAFWASRAARLSGLCRVDTKRQQLAPCRPDVAPHSQLLPHRSIPYQHQAATIKRRASAPWTRARMVPSFQCRMSAFGARDLVNCFVTSPIPR
jgi:hypothetical protein